MPGVILVAPLVVNQVMELEIHPYAPRSSGHACCVLGIFASTDDSRVANHLDERIPQGGSLANGWC